MKLFRRRRVFVDARVQGAMLLRVVTYWLVGVLTLSQVMVWWSIIRNPTIPFVEHYRLDNLWNDQGAVLLTAFMLLPVILVDTLIMSNRFAGPFHRLRRSIRALASGESIKPLHFRRQDYWRDVADDVNVLSEAFEKLKRQAANSTHRSENTQAESDLEPAAVR